MILYLTTLVVFLVIDVIGITILIRPVFERHVGDLLADPFRLLPAILFYMGYIAGVVYFVSAPAERLGQAALNGALLGILCYATYEFTNYATLRDWSPQQVIIDTLWGGALTGLSAWAGLAITRAIG